jgi:nucleotide-binding universal stress UspA family protein
VAPVCSAGHALIRRARAAIATSPGEAASGQRLVLARSLLKRSIMLTLGSVAQKVVQTSYKPVLVIPPSRELR